MTLGQLAPTPTGSTSNNEFLQLNVASGLSYTVPATGTITSWSHNAQIASGQQMTMKVYRKTRDPNFYKVVGLSGPVALTGGIVNTFPTRIPVQAGDVLGAEPVAGSVSVLFPGPAGDTFLNHLTPPSLGVGDEAGFTGPNTGGKLNLSAVFEPSNTVTVGATTLNKKKGTATLNLTLPNPGDLTASGTGVQASSAGGANASRAVTAGPTQVLIQAIGKQRKKLKKKGKVTLSVVITYTPENGAAANQTVPVKLQKKVKKKKKKK